MKQCYGMAASTQISQAAKDAAAEIDGGWDYASKCEVIQTAMNHAVGEIREQLNEALEHQELPYHTCAGKDCKNSHCQLRQERDRLAEQVEQREATIKFLLGESRTLRAQNAELQLDKGRLDWLAQRPGIMMWQGRELSHEQIRHAIDAAMQKEGK